MCFSYFQRTGELTVFDNEREYSVKEKGGMMQIDISFDSDVFRGKPKYGCYEMRPNKVYWVEWLWFTGEISF